MSDERETLKAIEVSTFGEVGYRAYADSTGGRTYDGRPMPKWTDLPTNIQKAWEDAAAVVVDAFADRFL